MTLRGRDLCDASHLSAKAQSTLAPLIRILLAQPRIHLTVEGLNDAAAAPDGAARQRGKIAYDHFLAAGLPPRQVSLAEPTAAVPAAPGATPKVLRLTLNGPESDLEAVRQSFAKAKAPWRRTSSLELGAGWPELSLRLDLAAPVDWEAKVVLAEGLDIAAGRVYWDYLQWQHTGLNLGLEGGYVDLHGLSGWTGYGWEAGAFVGAQVSLASWLGLEADLGPTHLSLQLPDRRVDQWSWVANTAIYLRLF